MGRYLLNDRKLGLGHDDDEMHPPSDVALK